MTEQLFQTDSYMQTFDAVVTSVNQDMNAIELNRTAFFPGGGGQPADRGILTAGNETYHVTRAKKIGDSVLHFIHGGVLPAVGMKVTGSLDWQHRYDLMRTHTALHILCGVVWRDYGAQVTGGNMEPLVGRMDFEFETMRQELVQELEDKINTEVALSRDVRVNILPREKAFQIPDLIRTKINLLPAGILEVRTIEIVGLDLQADGGTHVRNTSEVGRLRITDYKSKGKINKRIYLEVET